MTAGSSTLELAHQITTARASLNEAIATGTPHEVQQAREWLEAYESQARLIFDTEELD